MRRLFLLSVVSLLTAIAVAEGPRWHASDLVIRHSDVALMPEGTPVNYDDFRPLRPTVVAWGEDALGTLDDGEGAAHRLAGKYAAYRRLGARALATNVWMLTATEHFLRRHPELADTSCVDLWGERIVPAWLADANDDGVRPWWGCTNQPRYQEHLLARLRAGLSAGATMVHLDDHGGTFACATGAGGCFCRRCRDGFHAWLETHASAGELAAAGISSAERFDYGAFLRLRGYANRDAFIHECWAGRVPLWQLFLAFQRDAARSFVMRLRTEAQSVTGHSVPFGVNAYNLQPAQLFDADLVDYFANEVQQYRVEDSAPPVVYRLGEALGRPVFATGTGEDWIAYRRAGGANRVRGWIAEAYAFGQYFMYSWNKWGFSKETGTQWTHVPTSVYRPMVDFVRDHAPLFDGFENRAAVAILYDNASVQKDAAPVRAIAQALLDAGVPFRLIVNGDANLRREITGEDIGGLTTMIVPENVVLTGGAADAVAAFQKRGGCVVRSNGSLHGVSSSERITCTPGARIWALPRYPSAPARVPRGPIYVVHLLNRAYDEPSDTFVVARTVEIHLRLAGDVAALRGATYFEPGSKPVTLTLRASDDGDVVATVPHLDVWGIIAID